MQKSIGKSYILAGARTPTGSFLGALKGVIAPILGATAIKGALKRTEIDANLIEKVYMGLVISAGSGQAPARQAAIYAGLENSTSCVTVNKVCGSGMEAIILACKDIMLHEHAVVIAGGMENMSLAPYLATAMRQGHKFGDHLLKDSMVLDGLFDVYSKRPMGNCAEECVRKFKITRKNQDDFAIESFKRAQQAIVDGHFAREIEPVLVKDKKEEILISQDQGPFKANFEKMPTLNPVFEKTGTITAANASTINDGAAAIILAGEEYVDLAKFEIIGFAEYAAGPTWFTTAPVMAMKKCFEKTGLLVSDIDLFEINEAFSCVSLYAMNELKIPHKKLNIWGGAVSLGHPIGCSGTRIVVSLLNALEYTKGTYGMASICIGGGEALAIIIKRI